MLSALPSQPATPLMEHSAPPPPPPNRRLWSSPTFSDYFSGDDTSSFTFSPESAGLRSSATPDGLHGDRKPRSARLEDGLAGRTLNSAVSDVQLSRSLQGQRRILNRLNAIGRAILEADLNEHHCARLDFDIDKLEQTLAAPDAQSREPAEGAEQGLFVDDDAEDSEVESTVVSNEPIANGGEAVGLIARVAQAAEQLKVRFTDIKHVNDIITTKLEAAAQEIARLRRENESLLHADQNSELLYLKLRLNSLEERAKAHLDRKGQEELLEDIEQLSAATSPSRKNTKPIGRLAFNHDNDDDDDVFVNPEESSIGQLNRSLSHSNGSLSQTLVPAAGDSDLEEEPLDSKPGETDEASPPVPKKRKTPWERLWDELADFAGIHDEYSDELNDSYC